MTFSYEKYNADVISKTDKKRICCYFVVSDLHKITPAGLRLRAEELVDEIERHEDWILESVIWDANHKVDTDREGLNTILNKAENNDFDILLLHHVGIISRQVTKSFDYAFELVKMDKVVYGIIDEIHSFDDLARKLPLTKSSRKKYEEYKCVNNSFGGSNEN